MKNNASNTVFVNGIHEYAVKPQYCIKMVISLQNISYDRPTVTYEDIRQEYMEKLVDEGIAGQPDAQLKEDPLGYSLMGYEKEGNLIEYRTDSLEMARKFLSIQSDGVFKSESVMWIELTDGEMDEYIEGAIKNAKKKAAKIAKSLGKSLGEIISIEDTNPKKFMDGLYHTENMLKREYHIRASFELI